SVSNNLESINRQLITETRSANLSFVQNLIAQGADINASEVDGSTALLWATYQQNLEMVSVLLNAGANPNLSNRYGISPLLQSSRTGDGDAAMALLNAGADPFRTRANLETPLMAAASTGLYEVVERLLEFGADVNATEPFQNQTALMWSAEAGHTEIVESLIAAGAEIDVLTRTYEELTLHRSESGRQWVGFSQGGMTAVMYATREGHTDTVRLLAEAGADISHANPDGVTALMLAVINDRLDTAATLINYGANPNDGSMYELIQLHDATLSAVVSGDSTRPRRFYENETSPTELLALMIDAGGDPNYVSAHSLHADSMANTYVVDNSAYKTALGNKDIAMLNVLLESGRVDANFIGEGESLPLNIIMAGAGRGGFIFFAGFGQTSVKRYPSQRGVNGSIELLLEYGADVTAASPVGDTPLHIAAQTNAVDMIHRFHNLGADLNLDNAAGFTPLDAAMGERAPNPGGRGGFGGFRGGPRPQPEAITVLRELMNLPTLPTPDSISPEVNLSSNG
ncbi:ankyrin repeat domain-containing protein, partial [Gammaproteobacteria bacterium AH-315-E17]|nr:ankyrin repeat domain-containing protein [Gammaproteobacteria bacterium AH-315-E17]